MNIKYMGAILVIVGCGGFGFHMAAAYRREEKLLRQLADILLFIRSELEFRLTPLPALCRMAGNQGRGSVHTVFLRLAEELEAAAAPQVIDCLYAAMADSGLSPGLRELMHALGQSLGRFDLNGQLLGLDNLRKRCLSALASLQENRSDRLRSYQTLGLCAGAALVILFV